MSNSGLNFYILDSETTGLSVKLHETCEISIIRCSDKMQLTRIIKVDKPQNASWDALKITGKTLQDLKKGVSKLEAINDIDSFLNEDGLTPAHRCVAAHNSAFDKKFMHFLWETHQKCFQADYWVDTIPMCKRLTASMGQPKAKVALGAALDLFGIKKSANLHTAKGDAQCTYRLWQHLLKQNIEYLDLIKSFPHRKIEEVEEQNLDDLL